MSSKDKILALASAGVSNELIARQTGVSASYVSQVLAEDSIRTKVLEAQLNLLDERTQRDAKYDAIEDLLLDKAKTVVSSLYKPQDVLRALQAINKAERRGATSQQLAELANKKESSIVALELPDRIKTRIVKSSKQEIMAVNGRALVTKDSRLVYQEITANEPISVGSPAETAKEIETPLSESISFDPNSFTEYGEEGMDSSGELLTFSEIEQFSK